MVETLSIVVPMKDEADNVVPMYERIRRVMDTLGTDEWEIIMVNDGSTDGTFDEIVALARADPRVRGLSHERNYGQTAGLATGFEHVSGDIIVTMDADLQNPPEIIPEMLARLDDGYDVVNAARTRRQDQPVGRWLPSLFSNRLANLLSGLEVTDYGSGMKAMRRECIEGLELIGDFHRYYLILLAERGHRVCEVRYDYVPRRAGTTKYGLARLIRGPIDLVYICILRRGRCRLLRWAARMMRAHYYRVGDIERNVPRRVGFGDYGGPGVSTDPDG